MIHTRLNKGVHSISTTVEIKDGIIKNIKVLGGCPGNVNGIEALCIGQPAEYVIERCKGIICGNFATSCPDQIALCVEERLAKEKAKRSK